MINPWIIDEIRRREEQAQQRQERRPELPVERRPNYREREEPPGPASDRGVIVIDI